MFIYYLDFHILFSFSQLYLCFQGISHMTHKISPTAIKYKDCSH